MGDAPEVITRSRRAPRDGKPLGRLSGGSRRFHFWIAPSAPPDRIVYSPSVAFLRNLRHRTPPYCCEPSTRVMSGPRSCAFAYTFVREYVDPAFVGYGGIHSPILPSAKPVTMQESPRPRFWCIAGTKTAESTFWTFFGPNEAAVASNLPSVFMMYDFRCLIPYVANSQPRPIEGLYGLNTTP